MDQSGQRCQVAAHYLQLLTWIGEPQSHELACQRQRKHPSHLQEETDPGFASVGNACIHREGGRRENKWSWGQTLLCCPKSWGPKFYLLT